MLLGRRITDPASLAAFHRAFHRAEPVVLRLLVGVEALVAALLAGAADGLLAAAIVGGLVVLALVASARFSHPRHYGPVMADDV